MKEHLKPEFVNVPEALIEALVTSLKKTLVPELKTDAYSLNVLRSLKIDERVVVDLVLPSFGLRSEKNIALAVKKALVSHIANADLIDLNIYSDVKPSATQSIKTKDIADVRNIILVASGKGGVGKSTVASNLSVAMASLGLRVGLLDADVYGPSIPVMFGLLGDAEVKGFTKEDSKITYMIPPIKYDVSLMSIGFLIDSDAPMIWRGPMIASASMQMFHNVFWGQLDYLIVDLPPGTGDIQLTIAQKINVSGAIIVSTPQDVALKDVVRAKKMFDKVNIPNIGLIENMSYFICDSCDKRHEIFSSQGAKRQAEILDLPILGELPLISSIRQGSDNGIPFLASPEDHPIKKHFIDIAHDVVAKVTSMAINDETRDNVSLNQIKNPKNSEIPEKKRRLPLI